jgi:hypothetical protein
VGNGLTTTTWCSPRRDGTSTLKVRARLQAPLRSWTHAPSESYDTRHTCGTSRATPNVHPRLAMQLLRRFKINVTLEINTHVPSEFTRQSTSEAQHQRW